MAGFEKFNVAELRAALVINGWSQEDADNCTGKSNLTYEVVKLAKTLGVDASHLVEASVDLDDTLPEAVWPTEDEVDGLDLSEVEFEKDDIVQEPTNDSTPIYASELWSEYVFSQFSDSELIDGNPTVGGLRRVVELLLGAVIYSGPRSFNVHYPENPQEIGRATVVYEIHIAWAGDNPWVDLEKGLPTRVFAAIAGSFLGNTDDFYSIYPEAIAETRAEARALRKALGLKSVVAHEEITDKDAMEAVKVSKRIFNQDASEWTPDEEISTTQRHLIETKCRAMDINIAKFINKNHTLDPDKFKLSFSSLNEVPRGIAGEMVKELTRYQSENDESKEIPPAIAGFEEEN